VKTIFTERKDGTMKLRRDFEIEEGERILVVEDVLTTGGSINEVIKIVKENKGKVTGIGVVVDRSGGIIKLHKDQMAVLEYKTNSFAESEVPRYLSEITVEQPGSRNIC
jgi:orotate phosphoribosyltransferase